MSDNEANVRAVARLVEILDLQLIDEDHFRAETDQDEGRLFGGLILAQAVMAAGKTATKGGIHSLHAYFLRAGKPAMPVEYGVERIREGRTFLTRRVTAYQGGDAIFEASIGFTVAEEGISHQQRMPEAPDPGTQPPWWESLDLPPPPMQRRRWISPIDVRSAGHAGAGADPSLPHRAVWARPYAPLPEDPLIHAAALAYMSDSGFVGTVANHYRMWNQGTASLDHAVWFHHPPRFDDWLLYVNDSPAGHAARAVIFGGVWDRGGRRVASVAQEGLFRRATR